MKPIEKDLLGRFPKTRPELPAAYQAIYKEHYRRNREGLSSVLALSKKMEGWMHRMVAGDALDERKKRSTLEIGAGSLNHLPFEPPSGAYDIVEPLKELCTSSPLRRRVQNVYGNLDEIVHLKYDRIISIATFEHLCNLPAVVAKCGMLLANRGQMRIAVPSEGTVLWTIGWTLTTGLEFRIRHGLEYGQLMRHEHVNTADEIEGVLNVFLTNVKRTVFGLSPALSLYQFFECRKPDLDRCRCYLASESPSFD